MNTLLSIDPSIRSLGFAVFINDELTASGTVKRKLVRGESLENRIQAIIEGLEEELRKKKIPSIRLDAVVIEKPQLWGAFKSVASMHSGSLLGLHILVGALFWWGIEKFFESYLIPVSEWKGQLPKTETRKRMEALYGKKFDTNDESDAVGLGTYFIKKRRKGNDKKGNGKECK